MALPLGSPLFSGITILNFGQCLIIHDPTGPPNLNFMLVDTMLKKWIIAGELIADTLLVPGPIILGNPPVIDPDAIVQIYANNSNVQPQVVNQQGGSGDSAWRFVLTPLIGGRQFTFGIDNSLLNDPFKISTDSAVAEVTDLTAVPKADYTDNSVATADYFDMSDAQNVNRYRFYFDVSGTNENPPPADGLTLVRINIVTSTTAVDVADRMDDIIGNLTGFDTSLASSPTVRVTNSDKGAAEDADGATAVSEAGMTVTIVTQGVTDRGLRSSVVLILDEINADISIGFNAFGNGFGASNIAIGNEAGSSLVTGHSNTLIGPSTGLLLTSGHRNICIGRNNTGGAGESLFSTRNDCTLLANSGSTVLSDGEMHLGVPTDNGCTFIYGSLCLPDEQYETPLNNTTVTVLTTTSVVIIDPAGTLATLTIVMPATPKDGQLITILFTESVTAITHDGNGNTIIEPFFSANANFARSWYFRSSDTTWYLTGSNSPNSSFLVGPISSTDNAIVRFNGVGGDTLQNSGVLISDTNNITGAGSLTVTPFLSVGMQINPISGGGGTGEVRLLEIVANGTNYTGFKSPDSITTNTLYTLPSVDGVSGNILSTNSSTVLSWILSEDVFGPGSSTDTAIVRFMGASGKSIQNSIITIDLNGDFDKSTISFIHERGGADNFAAGCRALNSVTSGMNNTAAGTDTLNDCTTGANNVAIGFRSLEGVTDPDDNTAVGSRTLDNDAGDRNTIIGGFSGITSSSISETTAIGFNALFNATADGNVAVGSRALEDVSSGTGNVGIGLRALAGITSEDNNVAIGVDALSETTITENNVGIGYNAMREEGEDSVAIGSGALDSTSLGVNARTVAIGVGALGADAATAFADSTAVGNGSFSSLISESIYGVTGLGVGTGSSATSPGVGGPLVCIGRISGPAGAGSSLPTTTDETTLIANSGALADDNTFRIGNSTDTEQIELLNVATPTTGFIRARTGTISTHITQVTPTSKTDMVTLTIAELITQIIEGTPTAAGGNKDYTLPTAALIVGGLNVSLVNDSFDFHVINLQTNAASDTITILAGTMGTTSGNMIITGFGATTDQSQGHFKVQLTDVGVGTEAYTVFRIA